MGEKKGGIRKVSYHNDQSTHMGSEERKRGLDFMKRKGKVRVFGKCISYSRKKRGCVHKRGRERKASVFFMITEGVKGKSSGTRKRKKPHTRND